MNKFFQGPFLIIVAAVLWACDGVLRRSLYSLPPTHIIFFEHLIGALFLLPFLTKSFTKNTFSKKDWILLIVVSLLSGLIGTLFFTKALLMTGFISFSVVFLLQKLQPFFALITARIFLKEKIHPWYIFWFIVALVGAYFVTFKTGYVTLGNGIGEVHAALFAFGAAIAWGSSTTFSKMLLIKHKPVVITGMRFIWTTIFAFLLILIMGTTSSLDVITTTQVVKLFVIAFSTGMVALFIYYKGLKHTPVRVSTVLELTFPILAIIIDFVLYHKTLSLTQCIGAIVLVLAMYQITKKEIVEGTIKEA